MQNELLPSGEWGLCLSVYPSGILRKVSLDLPCNSQTLSWEQVLIALVPFNQVRCLKDVVTVTLPNKRELGLVSKCPRPPPPPSPGATASSCISHNSEAVPGGIDPSCLTRLTPSFLLPGITSWINDMLPSKSLAQGVFGSSSLDISWQLFRVSAETPLAEIGRKSNQMYILIDWNVLAHLPENYG